METVLSYYFFIALGAFGMWFALFWSDPTTPLSDRKSWIVLLLAALCWPITVPTSILKLTATRTRTRSISIDD